MDKQELIAMLLMVGFENWPDPPAYWWDDGVEDRDTKPTHSYFLWVGLDKVFVDFYPVIGNPEQHIVHVDFGTQNVGCQTYQEAWNHVKTLLPTGE